MSIITAHSGCDHTKDNSLEYLEYALSIPVDCIEVDVRKNSLGILSLSHDETNEEVPTLRDAFHLLEKVPKKKINCDLKSSGLEQEVFELAKECGVEKQLIYSGEVNPDLFLKGNNSLPLVEWYLNIELFYGDIYQVLKNTKKYEVTCINMNYHLCSDTVLDYMKSHGLLCSAWTVNKVRDMDRLLKKGIYNITTKNTSTLIFRKGEIK